ncbi:outer membrane porin F [Geobacter sp. OR-1]|uniref:OmpA family protein n=1 Tax=Geobacter sp. OR-1 TaxID=1266765 RepID=UPI00054310EC|nr:OmpA family protein [Geobacter sp. OR-1]GAM08085.1 outer membrane porin F [Geobacter sp. OR-1]
MKKRIVSMGAVLLLAGAATAGAENRAETFSLTPFVGGYTFDGKQHLETMPVVGVRAGYNFTDRVGAEAVFDYGRTEGTLNSNKTDVYNYHLDLLYHFFPSAKAVPFLMAGFGGVGIEPDNGPRYSRGAFNYGVGLKYALSESIDLRGEVRHLMYKTSETLNNVEYGLGLGFLFGGSKPAPPVVAPAPPPPPKPAPVVEQPKAAPAPPASPSASLSASPATVEMGTPATLTWACQNATAAEIAPGIGSVQLQGSKSVTPADSSAYTLTCSGAGGEAKSSANVAVIKDSDNDGVFDNKDKCPDTPAGVKVDANGCPPDSDRDGVPDYLDKCQNTPAGMPVDKDGCSPETLTMKLNVQFDTAKADIKKKYHDEIGRVAAFLKKYPTVKGTIEGHTDDVGDADMNKKLSQRRADSVMKYLVDKYGIEKDRLTAIGYGEERPIADNKTADGRQKNRRTVANFETVIKK